MKQQTKTKLLLIGLIIILLASCVPAIAQDSVNLELSILLDNKKVNQKYELILIDSKSFASVVFKAACNTSSPFCPDLK